MKDIYCFYKNYRRTETGKIILRFFILALGLFYYFEMFRWFHKSIWNWTIRWLSQTNHWKEIVHMPTLLRGKIISNLLNNYVSTKLLLFWILFFGFFDSQFANEKFMIIIVDGARYTETFGDPNHTYVPQMWNLLPDKSWWRWFNPILLMTGSQMWRKIFLCLKITTIHLIRQQISNSPFQSQSLLRWKGVFSLKLFLRNDGANATALDITAELTTTDSNVT